SVQSDIRQVMETGYEHSRYWPHMLEHDCLVAWRGGGHAEALTLAAEAIEREPRARVALKLLAQRPQTLPVDIARDLLQLVGQTRDVASVDMRWMGVASLEPLRGLPLLNLACGWNDIVDLSPLRGMPLRHLDATGNRIVDIEPLQGLRPQTLYLSDNLIRELAPLHGMSLRGLSISRNPVRNLQAISGMPLNGLSIADCEVSDLEPLRDMPLVNLNITGNPIASLEAIRGMSLREVRMGECGIRSLEPLTGMPLEIIEAEVNRFESLVPLRGMPLRTLYIGRNRVSDLSPLVGAPLEDLRCSENPISSLQPLAALPLRTLRVSRCPVSSLEPLRGMPLNDLDIGYTGVRDLRPLEGMPLSSLNCIGTVLDDLRPFERVPPREFQFDSVAAGPEYVRQVLARWERDGYMRSTMLTRAALALRRGDRPALRQLASELNGHRYLYVGRSITFDSASVAAATMGAHLVTITSAEEQQVVLAQLPRDAGAWLDMEYVPEQGNRWRTGEPYTFEDFADRSALRTPGPRIILGGYSSGGNWFAGYDDEARTGLLLEWDN
ncbi:MAG: hypothetical protein GF331_25560, partial [Chitinivibrionales bacterium]|nr:hypothetical protein [Chitinivibrionales bacterium]